MKCIAEQNLSVRADDPLSDGQARAALLHWLHVITTRRFSWEATTDTLGDLRALTRQRNYQLAMRIAAVSQLETLLDQHRVGGESVLAQLHSPIALDFLHHYALPQAAASLTPCQD
ncbi:hypothetical protein [Mycobacterium sp. AZCC_0083]|uniref:hypothetical protein n=1 Tax=Mycobacterium sp. AZCC_0083 TaxID=2735882 RepID=UPI001620327A|nr:hypothetical protein [Mycobacterium sp. AZCC_0083]MBB5168490.1 hypothetical protein [Mycobacterium sp. AZCC_0083]